MKIQIPYGETEVLHVELPQGRVAGVVHPNHMEVSDEREKLQEAFRNPVNSPPLEDFLRDAKNLLVVVNDATRPTPTAKALDVLSPYLAGLRVTIIVATGSHRAPTAEEYGQLFGAHYQKYGRQIVAHDANRDEDMVFIGKTKRGTEVSVNRLVLEADSILIVSSVEPHYFAGYTGGRKSFLPGLAAYRTIEQNHKFALSPEAHSLALEGNPVHEDMIEAVEPLLERQIFSIMTVVDPKGEIYACTSGHLHDSFYAATEMAHLVYAVKIKEQVDVVVSAAVHPMDINLFQAQKALETGKLALKDGGILILVARCQKGIGQETFTQLLGRADSPEDALRLIQGEYKLGYHKAAKMAEIGKWAQIWGVTDLDDSTLESVFIKPYGDLQEAVEKALAQKGPQAQILFMPAGSLTVPSL